MDVHVDWHAQQISHLVCSLSGQRCSEAILNMDRPEHHSTDHLKERERKRSTFHPQRSRTSCVQPDKHWHCFERKLRETAEGWGGVHMGLS